MLTQVNEKRRRGGETQRDMHKEPKSCGVWWRKCSSCSSSFPFEPGKSRCPPLTLSPGSVCGHMIIRPRYSQVYGSSLLPGLWKERDSLSARFFKHGAKNLHESHSLQAKCIFHTKCNTDNLLVQIISTLFN